MAYIADYGTHEPVQFLIVLAAIVWGFYKGWRAVEFWLAAACLSQLAYVAYVGGDFMRGRFLVPVLWIAAGLIILAVRQLPFAVRQLTNGAVALAVCAVVLGGLRLMHLQEEGETPQGWENEHVFWKHSSIWTYNPRATGSELDALGHGLGPPTIVNRPFLALDAANAYYHKFGGPFGLTAIAIGRSGYNLTPGVNIIDILGLADAFIAHLPALTHQRNERVGHPYHVIPPAYLVLERDLDLATDNDLARLVARLGRLDPTVLSEVSHLKVDWTSSALEDYYKRLQIVRRMPLLDPKRLAIVLSPQDAVPWKYAGPAAVVQLSPDIFNSTGLNLLTSIPDLQAPWNDDRYTLILNPRSLVTVLLDSPEKVTRITLGLGNDACTNVGYGMEPGPALTYTTVRGTKPNGISYVSLPLKRGALINRIAVNAPCSASTGASIASIQWNR
jgi:hypothetical protein